MHADFADFRGRRAKPSDHHCHRSQRLRDRLRAAGYTTAQLTALDQGGSITTGGFSITQIVETVPQYGTVKLDSAGGGFSQVTGFQLASLPLNYSSVTTGSCTVIQVSGTSGQLSAGGTVTSLDAAGTSP